MLPDALVARLAERQRGCVTHAQLLQLGLSRAAIHHRVRQGRLIRLHRGVYAVGHSALDWLGRVQAAWLAVGDKGLISHRAAAAVWRMLPEPDGAIDVTRPSGSARSAPGIRIHVCKLGPDARALRQDLPLTSPARTLLDLAETEPEATVARALGEAEVRRLVTRPVIASALPCWRGRRGLATLRDLIDDGTPTGGTRSALEDLFLPLLRRARLPLPALNVYVQGLQVDAVWRGERVTVELDGRRYHDTDTRYESDRARDSHLAAHGFLVLRFTYRRLERDGLAVVAELAAVLARRTLSAR
ncbi:MAG: AbiEi antitoxin N-terminal domain-containing protein [Solirubrobacteraceae bacterium]